MILTVAAATLAYFLYRTVVAFRAENQRQEAILAAFEQPVVAFASAKSARTPTRGRPNSSATAVGTSE
jgi:hypothetical protein